MHWRATANDRAQGLIKEVASYNSKILLLMAQRRWPLGKIVMQPLYSTTIMQSTAASASVRRSDWMTNSPTHSLSRPLFKRCVRGGRGMARRGAAAKHRSFVSCALPCAVAHCASHTCAQVRFWFLVFKIIEFVAVITAQYHFLFEIYILTILSADSRARCGRTTKQRMNRTSEHQLREKAEKDTLRVQSVDVRPRRLSES